MPRIHQYPVIKHNLPLPASDEGFLFQRHIKTKSQDDNHLSITDCNQAYFAKLAPCGLQEEIKVFLDQEASERG